MATETVPFIALMALGELVYLRDSLTELPAWPGRAPVAPQRRQTIAQLANQRRSPTVDWGLEASEL